MTLGYNNPNGVLRAPIFVGQSKGFFEEVGITSIEVNDADDYIGPLITGSFDIALADSDVLFQFNEEENPDESIGLKMIGLNQGSQPLVMIANEGVTAENLAGMKIGGARAGSVNEAISKFILSELGLRLGNRCRVHQPDRWLQRLGHGHAERSDRCHRGLPPPHCLGRGRRRGCVVPGLPECAPSRLRCHRRPYASEDPGFAAAWNYAWIQSQRFCKTQANKEEVIQILADDWELEIPPNLDAVYDVVSTIYTADNGFDPAEMDAIG